ncbi:hypothetical protein Pan97_24170 [Bremerella volcania]|uniref:Uncharacterized protein n=1 Tax=Bremerella volcania TaxID=2527984 RepID=A0A518C830_9BACT|nr:hypothetical protein Pan97_24170 [Bremerella volcania]
MGMNRERVPTSHCRGRQWHPHTISLLSVFIRVIRGWSSLFAFEKLVPGLPFTLALFPSGPGLVLSSFVNNQPHQLALRGCSACTERWGWLRGSGCRCDRHSVDRCPLKSTMPENMILRVMPASTFTTLAPHRRNESAGPCKSPSQLTKHYLLSMEKLTGCGGG